MTHFTLNGRRWPIALLIAALALGIGAVFGTAQTGQAAAQDKPSNTTPPTISGTPQSGSQLSTTNGTWAGTTPITFTYQWRRCDTSGGSCADIGGATSQTYDLKQVDVGTTLRVEVKATNGDGSTTITSVPTAAITAPATPAPTGCPTRHRRHQRQRSLASRSAEHRRAGGDARSDRSLVAADQRDRARVGLRRPAGSGRRGLRDRRSLQPVLGSGADAHGRGRVGGPRR